MGERAIWGAGRTRAAFRDETARPSAGVAFSGTAGPRPWRRRTLLRLMPVTGRRTVAARSSTCQARAGARGGGPPQRPAAFPGTIGAPSLLTAPPTPFYAG